MKRMLLLLLFCCCLPLGGCMGRQLEEQLLVIILAVDETQEGLIHLSVKAPSNAGSGAGDATASENGGEQQGYLMLEATGESFLSAVNVLHATTPRTLNFSQVREVVIAEALARKEDFPLLLFNIGALPRMRSAAAVVICRGEAREMAENQKPYVGTRLSRYVETTLANYAGKGYVPLTTLGEGTGSLGYGFQDPLFIYGAVNAFAQAQKRAGENELNTAAGQLPRKSANPVELFGAAATDGKSVSGVLTGYEMSVLHFLWGSGESLSVETPSGGMMPVYARSPATLGVRIRDGEACLTVSLVCEGHFAPGYQPDARKIRDKIARDIRDVIEHMQEMRCDGAGFGHHAVRTCRTVAEWERLHWRDMYCRAEIEVSVSVQLRAV